MRRRPYTHNPARQLEGYVPSTGLTENTMSKGYNKRGNILRIIVVLSLVLQSVMAQAHHVLGRPSYSLNEDSNTPPSMQVETQIGDYFVTYMVFPAFPKAKEPGRVNMYAARIDDGSSFNGEVTFTVRNNGWLNDFLSNRQEETLGVQLLDDGVYRQGFVFKEDGDYIVSARFESGGEPYIIDFPLRIGAPSAVGPIGITVTILALLLLGINLLKRRELMRAKVHSAQRHHEP